MVILPCVGLWGAGGRLLTGWWGGYLLWRCTAGVSSVLGNWCCWTDRCRLRTEPCRQTWPWCLHASGSSEGAARFSESRRSSACGRWTERSSPGNDKQTRVAKRVLCAAAAGPPAGRTPAGRVKEGEGRVNGSRRGGTQDRLLALAVLALMPRCYSQRGRWPVIKGRRRADSSLLLESEGSAQLGTAGLLSVCLSVWVPVNPPPSPPPSHIYFPLCLISPSPQITVPGLPLAANIKTNCANPKQKYLDNISTWSKIIALDSI